MDTFFCLDVNSVGELRFFSSLEAAQEAATLEDIKRGDCIYEFQLIGDEYEIVDEYGIECML